MTRLTFANHLLPMLTMALPRRWTMVRFDSRLAAQDAVNRIMQYVYTLNQAQLLSGPGRLIVWSTVVFAPVPTVYLNRAALSLAGRLGVMMPNRQMVSSDQLPEPRTLLLGQLKDVKPSSRDKVKALDAADGFLETGSRAAGVASRLVTP